MVDRRTIVSSIVLFTVVAYVMIELFDPFTLAALVLAGWLLVTFGNQWARRGALVVLSAALLFHISSIVVGGFPYPFSPGLLVCAIVLGYLLYIERDYAVASVPGEKKYKIRDGPIMMEKRP